MKSLKLAVLFGALSLIFMGCPYESTVPVDDQAKSIVDKSLCGKWEDKSDDNYTYKVTLDDNLYTIVKKENKGKDDPITYNGFLSDLNGKTFFNVWEKPADAGTIIKYYIYRVDKQSDDRIRLQGMTHNVTEDFDNSQALRDFITKYQDLSFFWDSSEEVTFLKD